jgi:hypothetical protein
VRSLGASFSDSFGDSWGTDAAAAAAVHGPWRLLSGDYPKPRERKKIIWPGDADFPPRLPQPAPERRPAPPELRVVVSGESPFREQILADLGRPVPRETDPDLELAIALLLAA